jgi:hypothetical protein
MYYNQKILNPGKWYISRKKLILLKIRMRMNTKLPTKALAKQAISSGLCILPFEAII